MWASLFVIIGLVAHGLILVEQTGGSLSTLSGSPYTPVRRRHVHRPHTRLLNAGLSSQLVACGDLFWKVLLNSESTGYIYQGGRIRLPKRVNEERVLAPYYQV